ncbi:MAG: hypothetical protein ACK5NN_09470 [Sphingomonadaceae bacterium]
MSIAAVDIRLARLLGRVRWMAWGAIIALLIIHFAVALVEQNQPEMPPFEQAAAHPYPACNCSRNLEII